MSGINALPLNVSSIGSTAKQVLKNNKGSVAVGTILAAPGLVDSYSKGEYVSGTLKAGGEVGGTVIASKILEPVTKPVTEFVNNKMGGNAIKNVVKDAGKKVISGAAKLGKNLLPKVSSKTASTVMKSASTKFLGKGALGLIIGGALAATGIAIGVFAGKNEAKPVNKADTDKKAPAIDNKEITDNANVDNQSTVAEPENENKASIINGNDGDFGEVKTDANGNLDYENSVKYGLNAGLNINEIDSEKYEVKYLPAENITEDDLKGNDTKANNLKAALIAEAVGELGGKSSMTVDELKKAGWNNSESFDINGDNNVTAAELAAANLFVDSIDTADGTIDGKITNNGVKMLDSVLQNNSAKENRKIFKQYYDKFGLDKTEAYINKQETEKAKSNNSAKLEPTVSSENSKSIKLELGKTLGEIVLANKKELSEKYGITQLWGKDGLVDLIAKENGFKGFQDENLKHLKIGHEFQI